MSLLPSPAWLTVVRLHAAGAARRAAERGGAESPRQGAEDRQWQQPATLVGKRGGSQAGRSGRAAEDPPAHVAEVGEGRPAGGTGRPAAAEAGHPVLALAVDPAQPV